MSTKKPNYWDSWRGQIIRAIIFDDATTWMDIRDKSGLTQKQLYSAMGKLMRSGIVLVSEIDGEKNYSIGHGDLYDEYQEYQSAVSEDQASQQPPKKSSATHIQWLQSWIDQDEVNASLENSHFFLDSKNLSYVTQKLLERSQQSILVVNPFVDRAGLGTALRDAAKRGIETTLITRAPKKNSNREDFHQTLIDANVQLYYSGGDPGGVHSKLTIVDDEVAIISSMNFTSDSEAAVTWETGIVTVDKEVVASVLESVRELRDQDETKQVF